MAPDDPGHIRLQRGVERRLDSGRARFAAACEHHLDEMRCGESRTQAAANDSRSFSDVM